MNRSMRVIGAACILALLVASCTQYVHVSVVNDSNEVVRDVEVRYTGGVSMAAELKTKTRVLFAIRPTGESALELRYRDERGVRRSQQADVYLERDYTGEVSFDIVGDHVNVSSKIRPR